MIHGEKPETMSGAQKLPTSIEVQRLGGDGQNTRTNSNHCTLGTNVVYQVDLFLQHCTGSSSKTYHDEQWVTSEIEVHGNRVVKHILDGDVVLEHYSPQLDRRDNHAAVVADDPSTAILDSGSISLQSESHPVDFRKVELLVLKA